MDFDKPKVYGDTFISDGLVFQIMMKRIVEVFLLFSIILSMALAWDGCGHMAWRCGDTCIDQDTECKCDAQIFNYTAQRWCCQKSPCAGRGYKDRDNVWHGEKVGKGKIWRRIGAECNGSALSLTQPCNHTCNFYEDDKGRNSGGVLRGFPPCKVANFKIRQCVREVEFFDGKFHCRNRADEEAFRKSFDNSSSLLIDLQQVLRPCKGSGGEGFECSGAGLVIAGVPSNCLGYWYWCNPGTTIYTCKELSGKTHTSTTMDPQVCRNQTRRGLI